MHLEDNIAPENIAENCFGASPQIIEIMKGQNIKNLQKNYRYGFFASGETYYCNTLQALGYMLLQSNFRYSKTLLIITDSEHPSGTIPEAIRYHGQKINEGTPADTLKLPKKLYFTILEQAGFIRMLTHKHKFQRYITQKNTPRTSIKKIITDKKYDDHNIVFLGQMHSNDGTEKITIEDNRLLHAIISQKSISQYKLKTPELYRFYKAQGQSSPTPKTPKQKSSLHIIAYLNSGVLGASPKEATGYSCILA